MHIHWRYHLCATKCTAGAAAAVNVNPRWQTCRTFGTACDIHCELVYLQGGWVLDLAEAQPLDDPMGTKCWPS
jgi:hypothetical protein